ncbi:MAG: CDP-diacylglycerol--serine O-phosphatidyltransferase [Longimicrobiales bacterium]
MRRVVRRRPTRARLQRGVIIVPSALTLGNLFFGLWAVVAATRGEFATAAWVIVIAGIADMIDGRVARVTQTGSRFGEELDSLVDAVSFGVAPAMIIYHLYLNAEPWSWIASFIFVAGAVIRLARFNIEQGGHAKTSFHGLPSPSAGMTLATFYPFSQTPFFQTWLGDYNWPVILIGMLVGLSGLMMSHVLYPVVPKFGFHSAKGIVTLALMMLSLVAALTVPEYFFFPALSIYIAYGLVKAVILGLFERLPDRDVLIDEEEEGDEAGAELRELDYDEMRVPRA